MGDFIAQNLINKKMLLAITEKEMFLFDLIKIGKRTVLTGTNDDSDDCITCSTQDEKNGMITSYPIFTSRYGKTKEEFVNEVRRLNQNKQKQTKMEKMYLQSVTRYTNDESGVTGYEATYSNGLDFEKVDFQIEGEQSIMNIPTIIKTPMTVGETEELTKCENFNA